MNQTQRHRVRSGLSVVLFSAVLSAGACGQPPAAPAKAPSIPKFDTPAACVEALNGKKDGDDPAAVLPCLSEAHANFLAGNLAFQLQRFAALSDVGDAAANCQKVLKEHGLAETDIMGFLQNVDSPVPGGATPGFMQIGDSIKDKATFFRAARAAMKPIEEKLQALKGEEAPAKVPEGPQKKAAIKLKDVKIEGDTAEAAAVIGDGEGSETKLFFKREKGSWVLAIGAEEPDWRKPIQGRFRFSDLKNKQ
jgi:hypothetical protein